MPVIAPRHVVSWSLFDQALVSGVNFLTGIMLARALGLSAYGMFALVWMVVLFCASIQQAVFISPMMVFGPRRDGHDANAYFGAVILWHLLAVGAGSLLVAIGVWAYGLTTGTSPFAHWGWYLVMANAGFLLQDFVRRYFFARHLALHAFVNDAVSYLGQLGLLVALFALGRLDLNATLAVIGLTSLLATGVGIGQMMARDDRPSFDPRRLRSVGHQHWQFSKWLLLSSQLASFTRYPVTWALAAFAGTSAVGVMSAAGNIMGVLHVVFNGMDNSVLPTATRALKEHGPTAAWRGIRQSMGLVGLGVLGYCGLAIAQPGLVASWFYGDLLVGQEAVVMLFGLTYLVIFLSKPWMYLLLVTENSRAQSGIEMVKLLLTLALCVPVIAAFGLTGAMALTLAVSVVGLVLLARAAQPAMAIGGPVKTEAA